MQSSWLLEYACKKLDQLNRNFLWSADISSRKLHFVGWSKVTKQKKDGGLGIRVARTSNEAFLSKIAWKVLCNEESVWRELIQAKYLKNSKLLHYVTKPWNSATWKGIIHCVDLMQPYLRLRIGNGRNICFLLDNWLGTGRLSDIVHDIHLADREFRLRDVWDNVEGWTWGKFCTDIPTEIKEDLNSRGITLGEEEDKVIWSETSSGIFTCQSAYRAFQKLDNNAGGPERMCNWIWKVNLSNKLRHFLWLAGQERLATNTLRKTRKITQEANCTACESVEEFVLHVLRHCRKARWIWCKILRGRDLVNFNDMHDDIWLKENVMRGTGKCTTIPHCSWTYIFVATCWCIWKARNERIFRNEDESANTIIFKIKSLSVELQRAEMKGKMIKRVKKWEKPKASWLKLNADGSVISHSNTGAAVRVIRDQDGKWQWGFFKKINTPIVDDSEIEVLRRGLEIAWDRRIPRLEVETDSYSCFRMVTGTCHIPDDLKPKVQECRSLMNKPWKCKLKWIPRTTNRLANNLAKFKPNEGEGDLFWDRTPTHVVDLLRFDMA